MFGGETISSLKGLPAMLKRTSPGAALARALRVLLPRGLASTILFSASRSITPSGIWFTSVSRVEYSRLISCSVMRLVVMSSTTPSMCTGEPFPLTGRPRSRKWRVPPFACMTRYST